MTEDPSIELPCAWAALIARGEDQFYQQLFLLWDKGCEPNAYTPQALRTYLQYAGFARDKAGTLGIAYLVSDSDDSDCFFGRFGSLPIDKTDIEDDPDYGPLTQFCATVHQNLGLLSENCVMYPRGLTGTTLREFYVDLLEDDGGAPDDFEVKYHDYTYPDDDPRQFHPTFTPLNGETARWYGKRSPDLFIEPGDPIKYWAYWTGDGDIQLEGKYNIDNAVNPLDYQLSRVFGINPENKL